MKLRTSVRYKLATTISLLVLPLLLILSVLFYWQFRKALDERVLLQLSSIKQLKSIQIEAYLDNEWEQFVALGADFLNQDNGRFLEKFGISLVPKRSTLKSRDPVLQRLLTTDQEGIHDLSTLSPDGKLLIGFYLPVDSNSVLVKLSQGEEIQQILLERTGMGETGETYLVGTDYRLRSSSRFYPEINPADLLAKTEGVERALKNESGVGIIADYRGVNVFSAFSLIEFGFIQWVILSELDQLEAHIPLHIMRNRLIIILGFVIVATVFGSLLVAKRLVRPLIQMKQHFAQMALGNFSIERINSQGDDEIADMFNGLDRMVLSVQQVMHFANEIGKMNLHAEYKMLSENDKLGESLIAMRERLRILKEQEENIQLATQKSLLRGQEKERERLSREMHDGLGPLLTSLRMMIQQSSMVDVEKDRIKKLIDDTISEVRRMTYNLMPQALVDFGVTDALANLVKLSAKASGIDIKYVHSMRRKERLPDEVNVGLYRIAQEALNNALKHSGANEIKMSLTQFDDRISFYFNDNGIGFKPDQTSEGSGLLNIRERCRVLGGTVKVHSDEMGSTLEVEIPL